MANRPSCLCCGTGYNAKAAKAGVVTCKKCGLTQPVFWGMTDIEKAEDSRLAGRPWDAAPLYRRAAYPASSPERQGIFFRALLAEYGIVYFYDSVSDRVYPVCTGSGNIPLSHDKLCRSAAVYATKEQIETVEREVKRIDLLLGYYKKFEAAGKSYDFFITAAGENFAAQDLYGRLKSAGGAFYAPCECRGLPADEAEALKLYAASRAKYIIVADKDGRAVKNAEVLRDVRLFEAAEREGARPDGCVIVAMYGKGIKALQGVRHKPFCMFIESSTLAEDIIYKRDGDFKSMFERAKSACDGAAYRGEEIYPYKARLAVLGGSDFDGLRHDGYWLRYAAGKGDAKACAFLGSFYYDGKDFFQNDGEAFRWFSAAAKKGEPAGITGVGKCYFNGKGTVKDTAKGVSLYAQAAEKGSAEAKYLLAVCYRDGNAVKRDRARSAELMESAAKADYVPAMYRIGIAYFTGDGIPTDKKKGIEWLNKAQAKGDLDARLALARCYRDGDGVDADPRKAVYLYETLVKDDYVQAMYELGMMYLNGDGVAQAYHSASENLKKAAERGHAQAMYEIAVIYYNGLGVKMDEKTAKEWYEKARENGITKKLVRYARAEKAKREAADGSPLLLPPSELECAMMAAECGSPDARYYMGYCYIFGDQVPQDIQKGVHMLQLAAEQGHRQAQFLLSQCYDGGIGVPVDKQKSDHWYNLSARP